MEFESVREAAERLGVTVRAVQKWAKENKLKGARRLGREWLIPKGAAPSDEEVQESLCNHPLMPLLSQSFVPGYCEEFIESISDPDDKAIAVAEYNYYKGQTHKAAEIAELYLNSSDFGLALSASFIYAFANLSCENPHLVELGLENLGNTVKRALEFEGDEKVRAFGVFMGNVVMVLMHREPVAVLPPIEASVSYLPQGLKLFAGYVAAHGLYLKKEYSRALGVAEGCLMMRGSDFPVASLYLKLMKCVCLMNLKRSQDAKSAFNDINKLALSEKFYQPFVEHHGLLQGIVETEIKKINQSAYNDIVSLVKGFSKGWRTLHNQLTSNHVTVYLTTTEFALAMLFNRNWSVKEISAHMDISPRMVKHHLAVIYQKLDVSNREELGQYLLK